MQLIPVPQPAREAGAPLDDAGAAALAGLIGSIGAEAFGPEGLAQLNRWMPLCWWSIYRLFDHAPPMLHGLGSFGVPVGTQQSWQVYRDSLYRFDQTFHAARPMLREGRMGMMHWDAREIPGRHRAEIYSRNGLRERLSIVADCDVQGMLAINLYRHESQPAFNPDEIDAVRRFSAPLLACVERHVALHQRLQPHQELFVALTPRERQVCDRLLKGWTHDGIAADLGLSPTTVKTYRDRAFERLGIHYRNELFSLVVGTIGSEGQGQHGGLPGA